MITYSPNYDTTVRTETRTSNLPTMHVRHIDWDNYPFDDPEHTQHMCCNDEGKLKRIEQLKEYLRICEQFNDKETFASNYGGWPRIWSRVIGVGMASAWPYWKPRPTVLVHSNVVGVEWYDWHSLTGAEIR
ncbi:MAG: hypothetical protein E6Q97_22655 [Desulfurellales bacterium]|nr:MAG: hypothetical protein E6Q97_22655 [Desulfurellales bacterium]